MKDLKKFLLPALGLFAVAGIVRKVHARLHEGGMGGRCWASRRSSTGGTTGSDEAPAAPTL